MTPIIWKLLLQPVQFWQKYTQLAGQPGIARAFALRAELCSSFLASRSLNPEMSGFTNEKDCFSLKCVGFDQKAILNRKECPVEHHCSHYTESVTYHDIRSNESWRVTKRVRRKVKNWKKKPIKRQSWSSQFTRTPAAGHGSKEWACCSVVAFLCTSHRVFSMKKKVLVVSALYRSRAVDQYRWVRFAGECLVFPASMLFQLSFQSGRLLRCFFFIRLIQLSLLIFGGEEKERVWSDRYTFLVVCPSEHHLQKERGHLPQANGVPLTIHGKKGMVSVKYTFVLIFAVTPQESDAGTCFWFLNRSPVSKGLVCTFSLHLLLIFFLVVRGLLFSFFTDCVCGFLAIRLIRVDRWILKLFYPTDPRNTDRPTLESLRKTVQF